MNLCIFLTIILIITDVFGDVGGKENLRRFPKDFKFGAATAAYQIEGGWNASDKGENIYDHVCHTTPDFIDNRDNGDIACDSYNLYKKDIEMLTFLGVDFYRFSISWSRLLPTGFSNEISIDGTRYYNALIDELLLHNITPTVTLYHWDLPQPLQLLGGWTNPMMSEYFLEYARVAFELFGDRVKTWLTFNEPKVFCDKGYGRNVAAPALNMRGIGNYLCGHTVLLAHSKAYHLYNDTYRNIQKGRIGLTLNSNWQIPASNSTDDIQAANIALEFELGWFANPIFTKDGDYPKIFKEIIMERSKFEKFSKSRLPEFTQDEIKSIKGTSDFFGLNHYTSTINKMRPKSSFRKKPSYENDRGVDTYHDPSWPKAISNWLAVVPWGFASLLNYIKDKYDNPEIIVLENGYSNDLSTDDPLRVEYYRQYLNYLLDAIDNGCNITGYTAWTLMDNFEWERGYRERFGLFYLNYTTPNKIRTPKKSAYYYKKIIESRIIH